MKIYDITKDLFKTEVYPGHPVPDKKSWLSIEDGAVCNLTELVLGSHSGTHLDAPKHFIKDGNDVANIPLDFCLGECFLVETDALNEDIWKKIKESNCKKLLIKGKALINEEAAKNLVDLGINLIGVESSTVGDSSCQTIVHTVLLSNSIVIVENLDLSEVDEDQYFLTALPLKLSGVDGSPVRACLIKQ